MEVFYTAPVSAPIWVYAAQILSLIVVVAAIPLVLITLAKLISWLSHG